MGYETASPGANADSNLLLTVGEAAERLRIGRTLMYRLMSSGEVRSVKVGRLRRVPPESLAEYVTELRANEAKNALAAILPLAERLERGRIDADLLAELEVAVGRLRAALSAGEGSGQAEDSAA